MSTARLLVVFSVWALFISRSFKWTACPSASPRFFREDIPISPFDGIGKVNYPMMKIVERTGDVVVASTSIVLQVSDEMTCSACHQSGSAAAEPLLPNCCWVGWHSDDDRQSDREEFLAGTSAKDAASNMVITEMAPIVIRWASQPNRIYTIHSTPSLVSSAFAPVATDVAATPPENTYTDLTASAEAKFFQLELQLAPTAQMCG